jgi:hypothetical protein
MVQHYIEEIGQPDHLRLVSTSDVFTPTGGWADASGNPIILMGLPPGPHRAH